MTKKNSSLLLMQGVALVIALSYACINATVHDHDQFIQGKFNRPLSPSKKNKKKEEELLPFDYDNEDLIDIINFIMAKKDINVLLPMGANAITSKLTLHVGQPLTLEQSWNLLFTLIDEAGYSLIQENDMYKVTKNSKAIAKEVIPLYVGVDPEKLPDTDERIRYLYYLTNLRVSDAPDSEVTSILRELLPADTASYQFDPRVNAILVTEKANNVKAVMQIIASLDQTTYQEKLEVIHLRYTSADVTAKLFAENILKGSPDAARNRLKGKRGEATFFSDQVKIVPDSRSNILLVLGKEQAVDRVKEFIYKYIDVEMESGQSILHVYQLLYLDAPSFAEILQRIVTSEAAGGAGQSTGGKPTGLERFFEGVIIRADQPKGNTQYYGNNKLIIAAKSDDWKYIKRLIEQLDKPQPQVIIEILVADLTLNDLRQLGSQVRNPLTLPTGGTNGQAAEIGPVVTGPFTTGTVPNRGVPVVPPTTIAADLLGNDFASGTNFVSLADLSAANQPGFPGSTLISLNDQNTGQTWGLLQLMQRFNVNKVLSHPHVVAINNQPALIKIGQERLVTGEVTVAAAAPTVKQEYIAANLSITITPRISPSNNVNLGVTISIDQFEDVASSNNNTKLTRKIITNANVQSESILALGGLIRNDSADTLNETPILARIPLIGWLFKKRRSQRVKTNLTVFICPTVIQPRLRGGINDYTKDYIKLAEKYTHEAQLFDTLRDPITRFFFGTSTDTGTQTVNKFIAKDELKRDIITFSSGTDPRTTRVHKRKPQTLKLAKNSSCSSVNQVPASAPRATMQETHTLENSSLDKLDPLQLVQNIPQRERETELKQLFAQAKNPF